MIESLVSLRTIAISRLIELCLSVSYPHQNGLSRKDEAQN
jgi:hypothetical protein